jgi:hypothetical protein
VEVVVAPTPVVGEAVPAEPDNAAAEEEVATDEDIPAVELKLAPQTPLLELGAPKPLFR